MEERLRQVFARVFNIPPDSLTKASVPQDIAGWNSAGHVDLILEIESEFEIQLSDEEVVAMVSFQDVCDVVNRHV
jgi:acyl carrier protein